MSTAFHIFQNENNLVCKNQDIIYDGAFVFTNQRGVRKTALLMPPATPASWVSAYGSLTVSQIGKENPNGGINEKGLVVEQTTLWQTEYTAADERRAVAELQWIQYMLDTCTTVEEVLAAASTIRIDQSTSKLHYLVADSNGDSAVIEFLKGKMSFYKENFPRSIIANSSYQVAMKEIEAGKTDWSECDEYEKNSMERLLTVFSRIKGKLDQVDITDFAFEVLAAARRPDTVFSLVYDINRMAVHANTNRHPKTKTIHLADFNFSNRSPSKAVDLQILESDNVANQFVAYNTEFNYQAVSSFFRDPTLTSIFQWEVSEEMIQFLARYPESLISP
ncbi:linear amide C-N hydrolase [Aneurinibacillus sp. Ricciae_BoGa-3]|uniref:linear amide C-N hydrolase n=1 Tax=Aneurinibacillus sp. Ricciae_BoGa-3 TaxID=3022697 RepID=UPI00233F7E84|nr:linear amide C-N hydrolase [Aneurinibacillus sp. Ricciae_BoGa-3]WCK55989.1 linear amide C-N hydrolase [Aneurinibacillus sp. Ricciae_BoGa-3]